MKSKIFGNTYGHMHLHKTIFADFCIGQDFKDFFHASLTQVGFRIHLILFITMHFSSLMFAETCHF